MHISGVSALPRRWGGRRVVLGRDWRRQGQGKGNAVFPFGGIGFSLVPS